MSIYGLGYHELLWNFLGAFNNWRTNVCTHDANRVRVIRMLVAADAHAKVLNDELKNKRKPSEIIANQVSLTFTGDDSAPAVSEVFPVRLMWGSDFPHNVSTWPNSRPFLENQLRGRKPKTVSESTYDNAASLY